LRGQARTSSRLAKLARSVIKVAAHPPRRAGKPLFTVRHVPMVVEPDYALVTSSLFMRCTDRSRFRADPVEMGPRRQS
jgi:hypothetical protein